MKETPLKTYDIAGQKFHLYKATMGQLVLFTQFMKKMQVNPKTSIIDMLSNLLEGELGSLMEMIFPNQGAKSVDWLAVDIDTVDEVVEDFLSKNPRLKARLKSFLFTSELMGQTATM